MREGRGRKAEESLIFSSLRLSLDRSQRAAATATAAAKKDSKVAVSVRFISIDPYPGVSRERESVLHSRIGL